MEAMCMGSNINLSFSIRPAIGCVEVKITITHQQRVLPAD